MTNKNPAIIYLSTFFATAATLFLGLCFIPDTPYVRYQMLKGTMFEPLSWGYERIHFDKTPIDIAILGNSRSGAAINSALLETQLNSAGKNVRTANFSVPASGFDIQLSLAKQLLQEKSPRIILISVVEQLPRDGHQAFADIAEPLEVLRAPWFLNRKFARNLIYLPMRQLRCLFFELFPQSHGYSRTWNEGAYLGSNPDRRSTATGTARQSLQAADEVELARESEKRKLEINDPLLPKSLHAIEFGVSEYYLDQIVKLAQARNAKVFFLFLPFYQGFDAPLDRDWLESRGRLLNARSLRTNPQNYLDAAHTSDVGSEFATNWLANELTKELEAVEDK